MQMGEGEEKEKGFSRVSGIFFMLVLSPHCTVREAGNSKSNPPITKTFLKFFFFFLT